jgi:hypothetical protein
MTTQCPHCSEEVSDTAKVCKHCGRDIKKKTSCASRGCLILLLMMGFGALVVEIGSWLSSPGSESVPTEQQQPSVGSQSSAPAPTVQTVTLFDGSEITISNIRPAKDWACGTRKTGTLSIQAGSPRVSLYYDRRGALLSITHLQAGNEKIYDNALGRECLMNWKTKQMELLTEEEYTQFEKEAGVQ